MGLSVRHLGFVATLFVCSISAPTARAPCAATQQNVNFEDVVNGETGLNQPVPTGYKGLLWQGFNARNSFNPGTPSPGIVPHSPLGYANVDLQSQLNGSPQITVNFANSNTTSFSLYNFYFGCAFSTGSSAASVPTQCNVQVTGYRGLDNSVSAATQVASQQLQYNPSTALGQQQQAYSGSLIGFDDIQFAIVTFSLPGGASAANADANLLLDNVRLSTKSC